MQMLPLQERAGGWLRHRPRLEEQAVLSKKPLLILQFPFLAEYT